jgi:hypothetical protein|tara:strand:+ start:235 stop:417 length:183 start_codon:yes stop_codon:yes gene_type:complete
MKAGDLVRLTAFEKTGLKGKICIVLRIRYWFGKKVADIWCPGHWEFPIETKHAEVINESR